ncbi:MAG: alpha/beta hydrolase [Candidatus Lokiarchaeia archaeon]|nr:alpha/beta hydrolase [Candidatus Lokiarchaeia archaeon]
MPKAKANNIEIEYDTFGDPSARPLLLVMGLGSQMISWDERLCKMFVDKGFYVIRFDNRDAGLSTKFEEAGDPDLLKEVMAYQKGEKISPPYTVEDMANDAVGLLDALNIEKAHICGASLGGFIVQVIALNHPTRVLSLVSMMSSTKNNLSPDAKPEAMQVLMKPSPIEREAYIKQSVENWRIVYGSLPYPEDLYRERSAAAYDRAFYPQGMKRQMLAVLAAEDRCSKLGSIKVPTLVIHGADDPLVPNKLGKETAECIPGSELLIIEGMGHSLPEPIWSQLVEAIAKNADKANN